MSSLLLFFSLSLSLFEGDTAASPWPYQHVNKSAQISNSAITSVYMDKYDYVWLGTWDGLNRYDGSSIKVYKPDPFTSGTISNNVIRDIQEDGEGNLWVITHLGINKYDRTTNTFKVYLDSLISVPFMENNIRASIGADSAIWISMMGKGISRYSKTTDTFLPVSFQGITTDWLTSVVGLGQFEGLQYLLGRDGKLICTVNNKLVYSRKVAEGSFFHKFLNINSRYYLAIANEKNELILFDLGNTEEVPYKLNLGDATVSSLSANVDHTAIWVGTEQGDIFKVIRKAGRFSVNPMNSYFPVFSKSRVKILTIKETKQDIVWIGTDGDGVYKFLTQPNPFKSITEGATESGQLSHSIVRAVYEDDEGKLYVGTRGGGLNIINTQTKTTETLSTKNGLSNDAVLAINQDQHKNIWIGLDGEGVDMIEHGTGKLYHFPRDFANQTEINFSSVYAICVDSFNDIWLGTSGYGVIHMKMEKSGNKYVLTEFDQLANPEVTQTTPIKSNIVYSIIEERPNILWFGTRGGGIYRYNALQKQIDSHLQVKADIATSLSNNDVLSLFIDKEEQLWVGSSGGLDRISLANKPYRIDHFTEREGLPNNTIHGILQDAAGHIWFSTNRGLGMYNKEKGNFKSFDTNDGLKNTEFTDGAAFIPASSSPLYFGGIDGLDIVNPEKLIIQDYFPRLTITAFQLRNQTVIPGDENEILTESIDLTEKIVLAYDQNFISFLFTTLDYWNKQKSEFSYFLENFDEEWNHIGQQQSITLTNIPPGSYTLYINYTNENGNWASTPKMISILVTPPLWKTPWAYFIYFLLAVALQTSIILYIRWRAKQKKAKAMDNFKAQQQVELNDYKLQFFTNIAHEFRTPLTLILGPVSALLNKSETHTKDKKQLKTIYNNSLRLRKLIDELIQFRKIESGKEMLSLSVVDLVPFTQEIVESFQQHAADREMHLEFYPEPETLVAHVDYKKIEKILINLISNAVKYNTKDGMISVTLKGENGNAIFTVRDDGIGISKENQEKIFESFYYNSSANANGTEKSTGIGLSLTKSLVQVHRGKIDVSSMPGKGSLFTVSIPVNKEFYSDIPEESPMMVSTPYLGETVSLEFDTDHYHTDQSETKTNQNSAEYAILVVDDHASIVSLLESILSDKYKVFKAGNAKKALEILDDEKIDLVISDVVMPDMDGLSLCRVIKENIQTSHIPVIMLTAKAEIENRIEGLQSGADSYIPKPFHPEHLFIRIEKLIERKELIRKKFSNIDNLELSPLSTGISGKDDAFFEKITKCIQDHLSEPEFNADTIAEEVGMSKASLYKKVKNVIGITPHGLIKQYRLKRAADLLRQTDMSVSEVIYETGFNSRSYFYKSFNETFHCHPKDFDRAKGA